MSITRASRPARPGLFGRRALLTSAALVPLLAGCGGRFPADTAGSLDRITGGTLRVGLSPNPPFTEVGADGAVSGSEVGLVRGFARSLDAEPRFEIGAEGELAALLHEGSIDVLIAGLRASSTLSTEVALTRPYTTVRDAGGTEHRQVMAVRAGENALLVALERYLAQQEGEL